MSGFFICYNERKRADVLAWFTDSLQNCKGEYNIMEERDRLIEYLNTLASSRKLRKAMDTAGYILCIAGAVFIGVGILTSRIWIKSTKDQDTGIGL